MERVKSRSFYNYLNNKITFLEYFTFALWLPFKNAIFFRFHCRCLACLTNILPLDNERKAKRATVTGGACSGGWGMRCDTAGWNGVGQSGSQSQSQEPQGPLHYTQQKLIIIKSESAGEMELLVVVLVFAFRRRHTHSCRWCLWFRLCFLSRWWGFHNICIGVGLFDAQVFVWPTFGGIIPRCRDAWEVLTMPEKQQKCAHWMMRWALLGKANITLTKSPFHSKGVSDAPRPIKTRMWFPKVQCRYKYLQ